MSDPIVAIEHLGRRFAKTVALDDVSLTIPAGRVFGLVGENGAGKTTLLKHVLGLLKAQQGTVRVFGRDPVADPVGVLARIGHLSEDRELPQWMRVEEVIEFTSAFYPDWDAGYAEQLQSTFELTPDQKVRTLSRGQQARLCLLLAEAHRPALLVLDEPSSGLDPVVRKDILDAIIRSVADEGRTVLFSSHLLDEVQRVSDHVAMLHKGRLVLESPLDAMLTSHCRLTVWFEEPHENPRNLPGVLSCWGSEREWTVIANGQQDELKAELQRMNADVVDETSPTLEEIFVARIGTGPALVKT